MALGRGGERGSPGGLMFSATGAGLNGRWLASNSGKKKDWGMFWKVDRAHPGECFAVLSWKEQYQQRAATSKHGGSDGVL